MASISNKCCKGNCKCQKSSKEEAAGREAKALAREMPAALEILDIVEESKNFKSFYIRHNSRTRKYRPGQFFMLWLPEADEKPFSASEISKDYFRVTVEKKGSFTKAMFSLSKGDRIGVRGPYGNGFDISFTDNAILVGGGCGCAPLVPLSYELYGKCKKMDIIFGFRDASAVLFKGLKDKLQKTEEGSSKAEKLSFSYCTNDGSFGYHGFVTDVLEKLISTNLSENMDIKQKIYCCGPEPMMKAVLDIALKKNIACECSLERHMVCGIGICGQCLCSDMLVCKDGPVFKKEELARLEDFGSSAMLKNGKKVSLKEYYSS